jgi:hypothetical protein
MPRQSSPKEVPQPKLDPKDYEIQESEPEAIEAKPYRKPVGKPKVRANQSKPLIGSHGAKVQKPTFGQVYSVYH